VCDKVNYETSFWENGLPVGGDFDLAYPLLFAKTVAGAIGEFSIGLFLTAAIGGPILGAHRRAAVALGAEGGDD
jgi:hypothetical protein